MQQSWQSTVIALGFIAFVGLALWVAASHDFATIWSGVGTIIGVLTGAIPTYFFKQQADNQAKKATAFAGALQPDEYQKLVSARPELGN